MVQCCLPTFINIILPYTCNHYHGLWLGTNLNAKFANRHVMIRCHTWGLSWTLTLTKRGELEGGRCFFIMMDFLVSGIPPIQIKSTTGWQKQWMAFQDWKYPFSLHGRFLEICPTDLCHFWRVRGFKTSWKKPSVNKEGLDIFKILLGELYSHVNETFIYSDRIIIFSCFIAFVPN